ncbi:MAG: amino acid ABC transporter permease [Clostridia bacterium]|nr:amino acid ABC transporter permease [Clostridia bacterium]
MTKQKKISFFAFPCTLLSLFFLLAAPAAAAETGAAEAGSGFFANVWKIVTEKYPLLLRGVGETMLIALIGTAIGLLIGMLTGISRTAPYSKNPVLRFFHKLLNGVISVYVEIFRGTPMMVQAMVIYWGYAFASGGNTLPLIPSGIFIVSINTGAYMAEIVRGGIISIDKGQFEGAASIGMSHGQTMLSVIIPQVMRNILPSVSNEFVINIKDTSVLNVIGVTELYYFAGIIKRETFKTFETYLVVCVIYFILTFTVTRLLRLAEKKLAGKDNYTIFGSQTDPEAEIKVHVEGPGYAD